MHSLCEYNCVKENLQKLIIQQLVGSTVGCKKDSDAASNAILIYLAIML